MSRVSSAFVRRSTSTASAGAVTAAILITLVIAAAAPAGAALVVGLEVNPDPAQPSELIELHALVSNTGGAPSGALSLDLVWPSNLGQFPAIGGGAACPGGQCTAGEHVTWNLGVLAAGSSKPVSLGVQIAAGAPAGSMITFQLNLTEGGVPAGTASNTVEVIASRALEVTIDPAPDPVGPGGQLVYDLAFANKGAAVATGAELRMPLPAGATFVSANGGGVLSAGDVVWSLGSIAVASGGKRRAIVSVGGGLADGSLLVVDSATLGATISAAAQQSRASALSRVEAAATLELAIEINPDPVQPDELLELRARVANTSSSPTGALTLQLHWPDHLGQFPVITGGATCPGGQCTTSELLVWSLAALPAHGTHTISVAVQVASATPTASLIPFELDLLETGVAVGSIGHTVKVETNRPLELTIDPAPDPVAPGAQLVYDLSFTNKSAAVATGAELRLPLPAGTTFVSATGGGVLSGNDVVWSLGSIAVSTGGKRRATVAVGGGLADGSLLVVDAASLTATISAQSQQSRATVITRVQAAATLVLDVEVNPDPVEPSEVLELRARVSNTSDSPTGTLTVRMHWPDLLFQFPVITGGATCPGGQCTPSELLVWNLDPLPAHGSHTISVAVLVNSNAPTGSLIPFELDLLEDNEPVAAIGHTVEVETNRPLELTIDPDPDPVAPGAQLVYDLSFTNKSGAVATGAELRLPLPAGTTFVSATGGGVLSGNDVVWNLGSIAVSTGGKRRATVAVGGGLADGSLLVVDAASLTATVSTQSLQSRATVITRVDAGATLLLDLEVNPDPVQPSEVLELRARVSNISDTPTGTLTLRMHWPDLLFQFPVITGGATCPGGQCTPSELLVWNLDPLPAHGSHTISVAVLVNSNAPTGSLIPFELDLLEDDAPVAAIGHTVEVETNRPLELTIDPAPDPVAPGAQLVYDLSFTNKGGAVASAAEMRMPLPAGTTFVSATGGGVLSGSDVVWNLGSIAVSTGGKRRVTVAVGGGLADGSLLVVDAASLTATVSTQSLQTRATAITRVEDGATLELALELDPDPVQPSELIELHARVSNTSGSPTGALTLRMHWPDLLYQFPVITGGAACPGGQCTPSELLVWNLAALPAHGSHTVTVATLVNSNAPTGSLIPFELELLQDGAAAGAIGHTVEVRTTSPLELSITTTSDPVSAGSQLVYELSYGNSGASPATSSSLRMPLPVGTTLVAVESGGGVLSADGDAVVWTLGTVAAKSAGRERVTVAVDPGLADGTLLSIDAATFSGVVSTVLHEARATSAISVHAGANLTLAVAATPDPVQPLGELLVGITVHNQTGQPTGAVIARLHWPEHMNQFPTVVGGAACPGGQCTAGEILEWNLGALGPNATVVVSVQENVLNGVADGTLLPWSVELLEAGTVVRRETETVVVHPFTDDDMDGTSDLDDFDDDNDGMPDGWETLHCLDPFDPSDASEDPDDDGATNLQEFNAGTDPFCDGTPMACEGFVCSPLPTLDIDGDGSVLPLTDGLLILRHLFGFTGTTLTTGAVGGACTRCTPTDIQSYLATIAGQLNVDGNGATQPLTDGLLILRYLFGFGGSTLTTGAVGAGCTRCSSGDIVGYLAGLT